MNHITNLTSYQYQNGINVTTSGNNEITQGQPDASNAHLNISNLHSGDIIQGKIMEMDGNQIKLMLNEGTILNARLEQEIQMLLGQKLFFAVQNNDSQISLSPLFENTAKQETGSVALKEAGLPITESNLKLVSLLMQEGLPIDKGMLGQLARQMNFYPSASMEELVQMQKLGLPINESNVNQFQQYLQNNSQMLQCITDVVNQVSDSVTQLIQQENFPDAKQMLIQVLEVFEAETEMPASNVVMENNNDKVSTPLQTNSTEIAQGEQKLQTDALPEGEAPSADILSKTPTNTDSTAIRDGLHQDNIPPGAEENQIMFSKETAAQDAIPLKSILTGKEMQDFMQNMKKLGMEEGLLRNAVDGKLNTGDILKHISQQLQENGIQNDDGIKQLVKSSFFKKILQSTIEKQWLLKPQDLTEEKCIERFYERLEKQTRQLQTGLEQNHLEQTPLAKTVQNMHSNINFMNDMNHMFSYIQLPLKLSQRNANGELYVYTNKKSLAKQGGDVSALLHLDMDYIGMLDIYIVLQNSERVSTNFKVEKEEVLELLETHMEELDKRLSERGYKLSSKVQVSEATQPVMQEILQDNTKKVPLVMYTFDAKA